MSHHHIQMLDDFRVTLRSHELIPIHLKLRAFLKESFPKQNQDCSFQHATPLKTNIARESRSFQKETSIPTIHFQILPRTLVLGRVTKKTGSFPQIPRKSVRLEPLINCSLNHPPKMCFCRPRFFFIWVCRYRPHKKGCGVTQIGGVLPCETCTAI